MARIELADGVSLKKARMALRKRGATFRITERGGVLYTIKAFRCRQKNTESQQKCRELLKKANVMAREDMERGGRREYWERMAREKGYKTAMGCARAWYIAMMKGQGECGIKPKCERPVRHSMKSPVDDVSRDVIVIRQVWRRRREKIEWKRLTVRRE